MPDKPPTTSSASSQRYVLLALKGDHIEPRLLSSASGLCRRIDAGLDIMLSSAENKQPLLLENFIRDMQRNGIPCRLTRQAGLRSDEIIRYANTHERISTVMINSLSNWNTAEGEKDRDPWRKLSCPLVVAIKD